MTKWPKWHRLPQLLLLLLTMLLLLLLRIDADVLIRLDDHADRWNWRCVEGTQGGRGKEG